MAGPVDLKPRALDWRYAALAILLIGIGSLRIASTYRVFNHTIDEPDHLAAGMEWLDAGKYLFADDHTPLARICGALLPWLAGERWHGGGAASYMEGYRILGQGEHYDRTLALARLGMLPFFWIGSAVVFLWANRAAGGLAGVAALALFTTLPPVLAHAGLVTTDMALTAMVAAAAYASLLWAEAPSRRRTVALGVAMGFAALAKWSALVFLPSAWLVMFGWSAARAGWSPRRAAQAVWERRRSIGAALAVAFLILWAGYRFTFAHVGWLHMRMPAPRFFTGIYRLWVENRKGHPAYLLGQRSATGFRLYYPVALGVKTPLGMLLLLAAAPWLARFDRPRKTMVCPTLPAWFRGVALPLAFSLGVLLFAMTSRINVGVRHVLPVYAGFAVACGIAAAAVFRTPGRKALKCAVAALLGWHVVSGALQHPDYLAYGNEVAGNHLEAFVDDSDLDWGQDMKRLGDFLRAEGVSEVAFSPFNGTYLWSGHPFPRILPVDPAHPSPGWNAVSVTMWKTFRDPAWADRIEPQWRIGRSILLWRLPPAPQPGVR
jgi:hypothetical protein